MCAGFVIACELHVECDPFGGDSSMPDISSRGPYQKRKVRNLLPVNPPNFVPGEKEKRPKIPWLRPTRQHKVPVKYVLCCIAPLTARTAQHSTFVLPQVQQHY
jgi:hypothetical protein